MWSAQTIHVWRHSFGWESTPWRRVSPVCWTWTCPTKTSWIIREPSSSLKETKWKFSINISSQRLGTQGHAAAAAKFKLSPVTEICDCLHRRRRYGKITPATFLVTAAVASLTINSRGRQQQGGSLIDCVHKGSWSTLILCAIYVYYIVKLVCTNLSQHQCDETS